MLIRFTIPTCTGKSVPAYLQRRRQHYCGTFYRKRGTGCGRYLQSGHDIGHSVSEWSVHGREYSDRHVLRGERLRYSLTPDQYDYDFRSVFSVILTILSIGIAKSLLRLLQVDASILDMTTSYLRIIFVGLMFTFLYNFFLQYIKSPRRQ